MSCSQYLRLWQQRGPYNQFHVCFIYFCKLVGLQKHVKAANTNAEFVLTAIVSKQNRSISRTLFIFQVDTWSYNAGTDCIQCMLPSTRNGGEKKKIHIFIQMKVACFLYYPFPLETLFHTQVCFHSYHDITGTLRFSKWFSVSFVSSQLRVLEFVLNRNRQFHLFSFHLILFRLSHPNNTISTTCVTSGFGYGLTEQSIYSGCTPAFLLPSIIPMDTLWQKHSSQYLIKLS